MTKLEEEKEKIHQRNLRCRALIMQKRQEQDARMTTGAPGAAGSQQQRPDEEKEMSPQEAAASAVSEMEDYRASRLVSY